MPYPTPAATTLRFLSAALVALGLTWTLGSCTDDTNGDFGDFPEYPTSGACFPACSGSTECFETENGPTCLQPNCGDARCTGNAECVDDVCQFTARSCSPACGAGQHCVFGNCVPNYSQTNVCDPLANCRLQCGTDARCLAACDADAAPRCQDCLDDIATCENRNGCEAAAGSECCAQEVCACFPSDPACGAVAPCDPCLIQCGGDTGCLNDCIADTPACSSCLQPFFQCQQSAADPDAECADEFCDCGTCQ